jgi:hypothetical protein
VPLGRKGPDWTYAVPPVRPFSGPAIPTSVFGTFALGRRILIRSRADKAIVWLERACAANAAPAFFHVYLAAACALEGDTGRGPPW